MPEEYTELNKKQKLRHNEYYDTQEIYDNLYKESKEGKIFTKLYELVTDERNIKLAYRNIKKNKGSKTVGTNRSTIADIGKQDINRVVDYVRDRLRNFSPHSVRRKDIRKPNGKTRPLGIPTIEDRLIQRCLLQVLEPICEAKFHKHSYGFRPNRGTIHAFSRAVSLANKNKLHYIVDVDIKGFFDNVNHGKLLKQMWTLGIRDKRILSIISKLLKAEIKGHGIPTKGTPQGGIISPLLSNIVLNEFDWWISNQWETFQTRNDLTRQRVISGKIRFDQSTKYRALKQTSKLKEMFLVRYADDFKIFCRDHKTAFIVFEAVKKWLRERLNLEVSDEKSKVINLRRNYSEFLGFKFKVVRKGIKKVVKSHVSEKARKKIIEKIKSKIEKVRRNPTIPEVTKYNSTILGMQNYYRYATHVNKDFSSIAFSVKRILYNKTRKCRSKGGRVTPLYEQRYSQYNYKKTYVSGMVLFPLDGIKHLYPVNFNQEISNFTIEGRMLIHDNLFKVDMGYVHYLMNNPVPNRSAEYNDNRISLYIAQGGLCGVTKRYLAIDNMEVHHKVPKCKGGTDQYQNLIYMLKDVHKLIHATQEETIQKYLVELQLTEKELGKVNALRKKAGNYAL